MKEHILAGLLVLAFLGASAPEASAQRPDSLVRADLAFASGLAEKYRYADLSEAVIDQVVKAGIGEDMAEAVSLAKAHVLSSGARYSGDPEERLELHIKALGAYDAFLEEHPYSDLASDAERAFVDITDRYGRLLETALADSVGEEAKTLRKKIKVTVDGGLERVRTLIDAYEEDPDLSPSEAQQMHRFKLRQGQMLTTRAKIAEEGTFYFAQAEEVLEDLSIAADETSPIGLQAYLQLSKVKGLQGYYEEAADFAQYVVNFAVPMDPDALQSPNWVQLPFADKQRRWDIVQLGMPELLDAYNNGGATEEAVGAALYFYNTLKSEGFELSPLGHLSLLSVAKTLLDVGGFVGGSLVDGNLQWFETTDDMSSAGFRSGREARSAVELSLRIAKDVNEANRGNVLQVRAQKLISEVVDRPGVNLSADVLLEAAEGEFYGQNYEGALNTYKRLLLLLERQDEATLLDQMPRALNGIGKSLEKLSRPLEAAMAYREASTTWKGDPEFQKKNADGFYRAIGRVRKTAPSDDLIGEMYLAAENLAAEAASADGGGGEIHWRRGERFYTKKDYAQAREEYLQVDPGEDVFEKARAKASLCHYKLGDAAKATAEFEEYLKSYVPDPTNTVTTKGKLDTRTQASAMSTYYVGLIAKKASEWDKVIEWLDDYDKAFVDQTDYAPAAMRLLMQAYNAKGDLAAVRDVLERMRTNFGDHPQTGAAAGEAAKTLAPLIDAAVEKGDETEADRLRNERAQFLGLANSLGSKSNYGNLRNESVLWVQLEEWEKAEEALRKLIAGFEDDSSHADSMEKRIRPDLGLVLLEQKRVPEALEVLNPLIPDPDDPNDTRRPRGETVTSWCRAIGGWIEGDAETLVEVPGAGSEADFPKATNLWLKLTQQAANENRWSCEWYELKFQTYYSYYRWGQLDSAKLAKTKEYIEDLRVTAQDPEFLLVSEKCGDELLRKRFLWLWEKVR